LERIDPAIHGWAGTHYHDPFAFWQHIVHAYCDIPNKSHWPLAASLSPIWHVDLEFVQRVLNRLSMTRDRDSGLPKKSQFPNDPYGRGFFSRHVIYG